MRNLHYQICFSCLKRFSEVYRTQHITNNYPKLCRTVFKQFMSYILSNYRFIKIRNPNLESINTHMILSASKFQKANRINSGNCLDFIHLYFNREKSWFCFIFIFIMDLMSFYILSAQKTNLILHFILIISDDKNLKLNYLESNKEHIFYRYLF